MPQQLYFRDDKEFVLLQPADLLMGDLRLRTQTNREWPRPIGLDRLKLSERSKPLDEGRLFKLPADFLGTVPAFLNTPPSPKKEAVKPKARKAKKR